MIRAFSGSMRDIRRGLGTQRWDISQLFHVISGQASASTGVGALTGPRDGCVRANRNPLGGRYAPAVEARSYFPSFAGLGLAAKASRSFLCVRAADISINIDGLGEAKVERAEEFAAWGA